MMDSELYDEVHSDVILVPRFISELASFHICDKQWVMCFALSSRSVNPFRLVLSSSANLTCCDATFIFVNKDYMCTKSY